MQNINNSNKNSTNSKQTSNKHIPPKKKYSKKDIESTLFDLNLIQKPQKKLISFKILTNLLNDIFGSKSSNQIYAAFGRLLYSIFGKDSFKDLENAMVSTNYKMVPQIYMGQSFLVGLFVSFLVTIFLFFNNFYLNLYQISPMINLMLPFFALILTVFGFYYAPIQSRDTKSRNIDINLPFALTHLSAISSSGSPPAECFRILASFNEFGAIRDEADAIVKRIDFFGEDLTTAIKYVREITPSSKFKKVLSGILTIISTGGSLNAYLNEMADEFMFDYKIAREKYLDTLGTYADIYTAILIAAPLFLVAVLAVLNIIPDARMPGNFSISAILFFGVYILIPSLNALFLAFVSLTQPEV